STPSSPVLAGPSMVLGPDFSPQRNLLSQAGGTILHGCRQEPPGYTPSVRPRVPTWNLAVVLEALCNPPFKPIEEIFDWLLTIKTTLLLALSFLKWVGDLQALDFAPGLAKAFLYPRAGYVPKPVVLQAFCPPPFREPDQQKLNRLG
ncbi:hypothetical protein M9458_037286, partial [Cirrhinus mrigala]